MQALIKLVELKKLDEELSAQIKEAQAKAINYCRENGLSGKQSLPGGDAVTLKAVTSAAKPTEEITSLLARAAEVEAAVKVLNAEAIADLTNQIAALQGHVTALSSNDESIALREQAEKLKAGLPPVVSYQVAVTLKK